MSSNLNKSRDITEFMERAKRENPVGTRAFDLALDVEFSLACHGAKDGQKVPNITAKTTLEDIARAEIELGERIRIVPEKFHCPDCGATLNTNWGHCPECNEWREL